MKGFVMKASMSEMVSLREEGDERVEVKIFLAGGCREKLEKHRSDTWCLVL